MSRFGFTLGAHTLGQLTALCHRLGISDARTACSMLGGILGPARDRVLSEPPAWPSDVSDDHTPVEFSVALDHDRPPSLRLLAETAAAEPSRLGNRLAALDLLDSWSARHRLRLGLFDRIRDVFLPDDTAGGRFAVWLSLVLRPTGPPAVKVYLDPTACGVGAAGELVAEGLRRLGLGGAWSTLRRHATRSGLFDAADWPIFFALDLHDDPDTTRVKVYVAHESATSADAARAAAGARIDSREVDAFCALAGEGTSLFDARPLISGYTFVPGNLDHPSGYSLYLPIRSYVDDDEQAWHRVQQITDRYGLDRAPIHDALDALTDRRLDAGVGLIAHVSLRLGDGEPGITIYLSSEAYAIASPRQHIATTTSRGSSTCR